MAESKRMIQPGSPPTDSQVAVWIGEKAFGYWKQVAGLIDRNYPGVFVPDWIFGGKKHGWCLRYKKGKSLMGSGSSSRSIQRRFWRMYVYSWP